MKNPTTKKWLPGPPLIVLATILLTGCAVTSQDGAVTRATQFYPVSTPGTQLDPRDVARVRTGEQVKEYIYNDYTDPNDPNFKYKGGTLQQKIGDSGWKLQASRPQIAVGPGLPLQDPEEAGANSPYLAQLEMELVKQKEITKSMAEYQRQLQETVNTVQKLSGDVATAAQAAVEARKKVEQLTAEKPAAPAEPPKKEKKEGWFHWPKFSLSFAREKAFVALTGQWSDPAHGLLFDQPRAELWCEAVAENARLKIRNEQLEIALQAERESARIYARTTSSARRSTLLAEHQPQP